jgi:hypothetical protein
MLRKKREALASSRGPTALSARPAPAQEKRRRIFQTGGHLFYNSASAPGNSSLGNSPGEHLSFPPYYYKEYLLLFLTLKQMTLLFSEVPRLYRG